MCCCSQSELSVQVCGYPRSIVFPGRFIKKLFISFGHLLTFSPWVLRDAFPPPDVRRADTDLFRGNAQLTAEQQSTADRLEDSGLEDRRVTYRGNERFSGYAACGSRCRCFRSYYRVVVLLYVYFPIASSPGHVRHG